MREALARALRKGYRKHSGQHLDTRRSEGYADDIMRALPQVYGLGEHPDIALEQTDAGSS